MAVWAMLSRYRGNRRLKHGFCGHEDRAADCGHPSLERAGPWTHARGSPTPRSPAPRRRCSRLGSGSSTARASSGRRWRGAPGTSRAARRRGRRHGPPRAVGVDEDESRLGAQPRGCDAERVGRGSVTVKLDGHSRIKGVRAAGGERESLRHHAGRARLLQLVPQPAHELSEGRRLVPGTASGPYAAGGTVQAVASSRHRGLELLLWWQVHAVERRPSASSSMAPRAASCASSRTYPRPGLVRGRRSRRPCPDRER